VALIAGGDTGDLADVLTYSHLSISEGLVPQDYSLLLRHSDENGWQCRRQFTGDVSAPGSTSLMLASIRRPGAAQHQRKMPMVVSGVEMCARFWVARKAGAPLTKPPTDAATPLLSR
jgi:hypothetical protein